MECVSLTKDCALWYAITILKLSTLRTPLLKGLLKIYLPNSLELISILLSKTWLDFSSYHLPVTSKPNTWKFWTYANIFNWYTSYFTLTFKWNLSHDYRTPNKQVLRPHCNVFLLTSFDCMPYWYTFNALVLLWLIHTSLLLSKG